MVVDQLISAPLYTESQRFGSWWMRGLLAVLFAFAMWGLIQQVVLDRPWGTNPAPDAVLILIALIFGLFLPAFMLSIRLKTEVRSDGIYVRFIPMHLGWVRLPHESIAAFEATTYRPLRDYGGWGIRWGPKGKAYNVSGNRGVLLTLQNGKRLLIGSQRADEFAATLAAITNGASAAG